MSSWLLPATATTSALLGALTGGGAGEEDNERTEEERRRTSGEVDKRITAWEVMRTETKAWPNLAPQKQPPPVFFPGTETKTTLIILGQREYASLSGHKSRIHTMMEILLTWQ